MKLQTKEKKHVWINWKSYFDIRQRLVESTGLEMQLMLELC